MFKLFQLWCDVYFNFPLFSFYFISLGVIFYIMHDLFSLSFNCNLFYINKIYFVTF